jgi:hypothetical protein
VRKSQRGNALAYSDNASAESPPTEVLYHNKDMRI